MKKLKRAWEWLTGGAPPFLKILWVLIGINILAVTILFALCFYMLFSNI